MSVTVPKETVEEIKEKPFRLSIVAVPMNGESAFLVTMTLGGEPFEGDVSIKLPFDSSIGSDPKVYMRSGSTDTPMQAVYDGSSMIFDATKGGQYVIVYNDEPEPASADNVDYALIAAFIIAMLAAAYVGIITRR